jgi:hypothetical protein
MKDNAESKASDILLRFLVSRDDEEDEMGIVDYEESLRLAITCVDEILKALSNAKSVDYWLSVRSELQKKEEQ